MDPRPRILVVDDEKRAVELLKRSLRKTGRVDVALSGEEAIEKIEQGYYELIISDQKMPGLCGVDVLAIAAERNPTCGRVLLTGYSDLEATVAAINRGRVHAYLHKPCSPDDLLMVVGNVLDRVRLSQENLRLVSVVTEQNEELQRTLTELQATQEKVVASERLAAIGKMIAMVVHDLRAPIAVIQSAGLETVAEGESRKIEEVIALGRDVVAEAERMRHMCEDLLSITRATEGDAKPTHAPLDDVVDLCLAPLRRQADRRGVTIETNLGAPCHVRLDEARFRRAIENLVQNAVDALDGAGTIRVDSRAEDGDAIVTISDDGPGVPAEIADVLFEPFSTAGKEGGTGLGLAIVRKVVEDHGGSVSHRASDLGGASFEIRLPVPPTS